MRKSASTAVTVLVAAALVVLAACGKSSSSDKADPAKDKTTANGLVLQQADFPAGWTSTAAVATNAAQAKELATCVGRPDPATTTSAYVDGPDFAFAQSAQLSSNATIVKQESDAKADVAAFKSDKIKSCLTTSFNKGVAAKVPGAEISNLTVTAGEAPNYGDASASWHLTADVNIAALGVKLPISVDFVAIQKGRVEVTASFVGTGAPFDPALEKVLVAKVGGRLAKG